jgi:hypothetical protein
MRSFAEAETPTPGVFCVNAVDKGFRTLIGVKAVDKGLISNHRWKKELKGDTPGVCMDVQTKKRRKEGFVKC